ncbi:uncharacterized protein LOC103840792 isoform X2 [Brassica rapa]|uniref:uncharacterized protein BNAA09G30080D isoform X2 n=1 Tax=Brassica napus TaxID=3708 RepID=UPI000BBE6A32|nr:uncharacterized protein BNAA09G30080D isoform X2 [Brassica napus]XP_033136301.1 uncharacterized protein LOC103840792 isoform X2 [Brassica rapa]
MLYKLKKREVVKGNRILISVTFLGSPGPIRFVAYEGDLVAAVIDTALKCYAREALSPWEAIGSLGARNFMLCEKSEEKKKLEEENGRSSFPINGARKRSFRAWINKSFSLKVTTH